MLPNTLLGGVILSMANMVVVFLVLGVLATLIELIHMLAHEPAFGPNARRTSTVAGTYDPPGNASIGVQELPMKVKH